MKILFICPPDIHSEGFDVGTAKRRRYLNYPPYGLGLLAAIAEEKGHGAQIVNLQSEVLWAAQTEPSFDFDAAWQSALPDERPDLIALTCMFSQTHKSLQRVSAYCAERYPGVKQIAGGVHVTNSLAQAETRAQFVAALPHIAKFFTHEAEQEFSAYLDGRSLLQGRLPPNGRRPEPPPCLAPDGPARILALREGGRLLLPARFRSGLRDRALEPRLPSALHVLQRAQLQRRGRAPPARRFRGGRAPHAPGRVRRGARDVARR
jgi:hypothetical protein